MCNLVRYYGHYSVRSRAERRKKAGAETDGIRSESPPPASERRRRWAEQIRLVYEVDPLRCDKCGGVMKIVSFISTAQSEVIRRILEHLGGEHGRPPGPRAPGVGGEVRAE